MPDPAHPDLEVTCPGCLYPDVNHHAHSLRKGWRGLPKVPLDGTSWTPGVAAALLDDISEKHLRQLIEILDIFPSGTMNTRGYRSQGRIPRAYPARKLIRAVEVILDLREELRDPPDSA